MIRDFEYAKEIAAEGAWRFHREVVDGVPRLIRSAPIDADHPARAAALRHAWSVTRALVDNPAVALASALDRRPTQLVLVYADADWVPLSATPRPAGAAELLRLALGMARALASVHEAGIVHRGVRPDAFLVGPDGAVKLAIFDYATRASGGLSAIVDPALLGDRLPYIAPEQTGRLNRPVDHRADLYGLGVTLYWLFAGQLPLHATDPLGWVHAHLARRPRPITGLSPALGEIALRLLAKDPDARYQSAAGLVADLARAEVQLAEAGHLDGFELNGLALADRFQLPTGLYGRAVELDLLQAGFAGAREAAAVAYVTGDPGIGKSRLIHELLRSVGTTSGFFVEGKADQYRRGRPYDAVLDALGSLLRQIAMRTEGQIAEWRAALADALGESAGVVTEALPEAVWLLGAKPPPARVGADEAELRFRLTLTAFVRVFATPAHPLVLFLDDLQWADRPSLTLLQQLLTVDPPAGLYVVAAWRPAEVDEDHPLNDLIAAVDGVGLVAERLHLGPLPIAAVEAFVGDAVGRPDVRSQALARLVAQKTASNPFFVSRFLLSLHEDGLLRFVDGHWTWDAAEIAEAALTDNVVELMQARIGSLPEATRAALQRAAAIGGRTDLATLSQVLGGSPWAVLERLRPAIEAQLINVVGESDAALDEGDDGRGVELRFAHDRVQEAAYAQLDESTRAALHLEIGQLLQAAGARVFELAHHFGRAQSVLRTGPDASRREAVALQLEAGAAALAGGAHAPARDFLRTGASMLSEDAWESDYELSLSVHTKLAEAERAAGDPKQALALIDVVDAHARAPIDRAPTGELRIYLYNNEMRLVDAVEATLNLVAALGYPVAAPTSEADVIACIQAIAEAIGERPIEAFADAPELTDPTQRAAVRVMAGSLATTAISRPEMHVPMLARALLICLEHGVCGPASTLFGHYGIVMCAIGQHDLGYAAGKTAMALNRRFAEEGPIGGLVEFPVFIQHWREPIREVVELLRANARRSLELGDPTIYGYCINQLLLHEVLGGYPLATLEARYGKYRTAMIDYHQHLALPVVDTFGQAIACLLGDAPNPARVDGARFDFAANLGAFAEFKVATSIVYAVSVSMMVATTYGDFEHVVALDREYATWLASPLTQSAFPNPLLMWYAALAHLALGDEAAAAPQIERLKAVVAVAPHAHAHRLALVEAEQARLAGDVAAALEGYDRAAAMAAERRFPQDEALAYEKAAQYHDQAGRGLIGGAYWRAATEAYDRWGATGKVAQLRDAHADVLGGVRQVSSDGLDLNTVMAANEALAGEIELSRLLERLMRILVENAGAERAVLLLERGDALLVEAELVADAVSVLQSTPLEDHPALPHDLVRLVARTGEAVVLDDALRSPRFATLPDVQARRVRSLLCSTLVHQGKHVGVVYLENNLTAGAFTEARIALLRALSTQAATALVNAILYSEARHTSEQLAQQNEALLGLDRMRADFLARTSHELRTPLHGIIGIAQSLMEGSTGRLDGATNNNLGMIVQSGRRLANLINDLLDLQAVQRGGLRLRRQPTDLGERVAAVRELAAGLVAFKAVELVVEAPAALPLVSADGDRVEQVLFNLIGNAIKFTESGQVKVTLRAEGDRVWVSVEDTGVGIAPEVIDRIFQEFDQGDSELARDLGGAGIGLAVSKQIVEAHGGEIEVESTLGVGSVFRFSLPVATGAEVVAARSRQATAQRAALGAVELSPAPTPAEPNSATVLVVDDEPINLQVIINQLSRRGYEVITAMSGEEALGKMAAGLRPDIVLLDVMMPRMDGYTVCQRIRTEHSANALPVVMLTAKDQTNDLVEGLAAGANDYVTKPFSSEALLARIRTQLALSSINRAVGRFVPVDFVRLLGHDSIVDLRAGDHVSREMAVMFANVRAFRELAGAMSAEENFGFINEYLGLVEPAVLGNHGVVDKYIGDAVMALFDAGAADALAAGVEVARAIAPFNQARITGGKLPVQIGIGINVGSLVLGAVGTENRMDTTVISDVVNAASRVQGLTKRYQSQILVSQAVLEALDEPDRYATRLLDEVRWGEGPATSVYEVYEADPPGQKAGKDATKAMFEQGVRAFHGRALEDAKRFFSVCRALDPTDLAVSQYLERLSKIQAYFTGPEM